MKVGEKIVLADGQLNEAIAEIVASQKDSLEVKILERQKNQNEPNKKIVLYCSVLKRENFEWVVQKAAEVGVLEIRPLVCERTIKTDFKKERLQKIIKEAAEQSGRGRAPVLRETVKFSEAVKDAQNNKANFFFNLSGAN